MLVSFEFLETTVEPSCGGFEPLSAVCEQPMEAWEQKFSTKVLQQLGEKGVNELSQCRGVTAIIGSPQELEQGGPHVTGSFIKL